MKHCVFLFDIFRIEVISLDSKVIRGRGRPETPNSRKNTRTVRLDDEEEAMLRHMEIEMDVNISDIIRKAIRMFYNFKFGRM